MVSGSAATVGVSAAFIFYGLSLHRADRELTLANATLAELSRRDTAHARFLTDVSEIADVGGWRWDPQDNTLEWSGATQRIHDLPPDYRPPGGAAISFVRDDHREILTDLMSQALGHDERITADLPIITATGRPRWVRISGRRHLEPDGRAVLIGALQDITERRDTQDRLTELAEAAQAASRAKDGFLTNMSHEIRTPLTA
jgi:PAS domain S-box-containing protein